MNCAACCCDIGGDEQYLVCTRDSCNKMYHYLCAGGENLAELGVNSWICPECSCMGKRGGDNSATPVGSIKKHPRDDNVTHRRKMKTSCGASGMPLMQSIEPSSSDVHRLQVEMQSLKDQLSHAVTVIKSYELKMASHTEEVRALINTLTTLVKVAGAAVVTLPPHLPEPVQPQAADKTPDGPQHTGGVEVLEPVSVNLPSDLIPPVVVQHVDDSPTSIADVPIVKSAKMYSTAAAAAVPAISVPEQTTLKKNGNKPNKHKRPLNSKPPLNTSEITAHPANRRELKTFTQQVTSGPNPSVIGKRQLPSLLCGTAGPAKTKLKAVEPRKYIHLWNMESNADEIKDYLGQLYPTGSFTVQELKPKGDYRSYKIGVPLAAYDLCYCTEAWPINARLKPWVPYHRPSNDHLEDPQKPADSTDSNQPFRGATKA